MTTEIISINDWLDKNCRNHLEVIEFSDYLYNADYKAKPLIKEPQTKGFGKLKSERGMEEE